MLAPEDKREQEQRAKRNIVPLTHRGLWAIVHSIQNLGEACYMFQVKSSPMFLLKCQVASLTRIIILHAESLSLQP